MSQLSNDAFIDANELLEKCMGMGRSYATARAKYAETGADKLICLEFENAMDECVDALENLKNFIIVKAGD